MVILRAYLNSPIKPCYTVSGIKLCILLCHIVSTETAWVRFPKAGKLPHVVGTVSQGWKASPRCGHGFPRLESFPMAWARIPKAGKLPHGVGTDSQVKKRFLF